MSCIMFLVTLYGGRTLLRLWSATKVLYTNVNLVNCISNWYFFYVFSIHMVLCKYNLCISMFGVLVILIFRLWYL